MTFAFVEEVSVTFFTFAEAPFASEEDACASMTERNAEPFWRSEIFLWAPVDPEKNATQFAVMAALGDTAVVVVVGVAAEPQAASAMASPHTPRPVPRRRRPWVDKVRTAATLPGRRRRFGSLLRARDVARET